MSANVLEFSITGMRRAVRIKKTLNALPEVAQASIPHPGTTFAHPCTDFLFISV
jgi:hypothetical protein